MFDIGRNKNLLFYCIRPEWQFRIYLGTSLDQESPIDGIVWYHVGWEPQVNFLFLCTLRSLFRTGQLSVEHLASRTSKVLRYPTRRPRCFY